MRALVNAIRNTKGEIKKGIEELCHISETMGVARTGNKRENDKVTETKRMTTEVRTQTEPICP